METGRLHITGDETHELMGRNYVFHRVFKQIQAWSAANFSDENGIVPEDEYDKERERFASSAVLKSKCVTSKGLTLQRILINSNEFVQVISSDGRTIGLHKMPEF